MGSGFCFQFNLNHVNICFFQEVNTIFQPVIIKENYPLDSGLNNQFRTFEARG